MPRIGSFEYTHHPARVPALDRGDLAFSVYYIAPEASYATWRSTSAQGGFDLKTFEVRARPSEAAALRPGMSVIAQGRLSGTAR
jgi:HlyD family secretion protein